MGGEVRGASEVHGSSGADGVANGLQVAGAEAGDGQRLQQHLLRAAAPRLLGHS